MEKIIRYTKITPITRVISDFRELFYSKHNDWVQQVLDEEIPIIKKSMKQFVQQLGIIQTKNTAWKAIYFDSSSSYIKFENLNDSSLVSYYDMTELDRRYIDLKIDKWIASLI